MIFNIFSKMPQTKIFENTKFHSKLNELIKQNEEWSCRVCMMRKVLQNVLTNNFFFSCQYRSA